MTDERLQRLLGGPALAALRRRLRQRYEFAPSGLPPPAFRIDKLAPHERSALAALQGQRPTLAMSIRVDVPAIDAALLRAGVAGSLREALAQLDGPLVDRAAEREAVRSQWREAFGACTQPALVALLQVPAGASLARRIAAQSPQTSVALFAQAEAVLRRLPVCGVTRAHLAADTLGDAHALDAGRPVASLVLAALRQGQAVAVANQDKLRDGNEDGALAGNEEEARGDSARDLWASAGVLVNELARPALFLNLPADNFDTPWGEPGYLSLRALLRTPVRWRVAGRKVYVCENPNLLAIAAEQLGPRCAPMVCTDGMPAAAQRSLLEQLAGAGAALHYHGDFDWPGLGIGNLVMDKHGAVPWRFGADDYRAALALAPQPGRALQGTEIAASWDTALGPAMRTGRRAIDEEMVFASLLPDLETPKAA